MSSKRQSIPSSYLCFYSQNSVQSMKNITSPVWQGTKLSDAKIFHFLSQWRVKSNEGVLMGLLFPMSQRFINWDDMSNLAWEADSASLATGHKVLTPSLPAWAEGNHTSCLSDSHRGLLSLQVSGNEMVRKWQEKTAAYQHPNFLLPTAYFHLIFF